MSTAAAPHPYIEALLKGPGAPAAGATWLERRRAHALERANALAVPTTRDEEWRFTDLAPLTRVPFQPAAAAPRLQPDDIAAWIVPEAAARLVFVDGAYAPDLSATEGLPAGVTVTNLAAALSADSTGLEPHLARYAGFEREVFTAVNTARLRDGALVRIAAGRNLPGPVHVLFVSTQAQAAVYPRVLVVAEPGAACMLIEDYAGTIEGPYFNAAVTEIVAGEGARVRHVRLQREALAAFHVAACAVAVAKDAHYDSHAVALGARISRYNLDVVQGGEGAEISLDGLALVDGRQLSDTHTFMDHAQPHGRCVQLHKCIAGGGGHAVFNGKILVRPGAQLTNSAQQSRNLLLSEKAHVDTKPQLEIFADDVKCAHGATVGQLDAEHLFYLRSRGLSASAARNLLVYAFGAEVIDRIPVPSLVERLEKVMMMQTAKAGAA